VSQNKTGDSGQVTEQKFPSVEDAPLNRKTGASQSLRIVFAVLFFGCTGYLMFSEILLTVLRMMGINQ